MNTDVICLSDWPANTSTFCYTCLKGRGLLWVWGPSRQGEGVLICLWGKFTVSSSSQCYLLFVLCARLDTLVISIIHWHLHEHLPFNSSSFQDKLSKHPLLSAGMSLDITNSKLLRFEVSFAYDGIPSLFLHSNIFLRYWKKSHQSHVTIACSN